MSFYMKYIKVDPPPSFDKKSKLKNRLRIFLTFWDTFSISCSFKECYIIRN